MENIHFQIDPDKLEHNFSVKITKQLTKVKITAKKEQSSSAAMTPVNQFVALQLRNRVIEMEPAASKTIVQPKYSKRCRDEVTDLREPKSKRAKAAVASTNHAVVRQLRNRAVAIGSAASTNTVQPKNSKRCREEVTDPRAPKSKRAKSQNMQLVPAQRQFKIDDLVVTRVRGWSAWPARVTKINNPGRKFEVQYFGFDNMKGAVGINEIFHFDEHSIGMLGEVLAKKPNLKCFVKSLLEVQLLARVEFPFEIPN